MKKHSLCKLILLLIVVWIISSHIIRAIQGESFLFLIDIFYRNKAYAKKIDIQSYLLTDEQVLELFLHPNAQIKQFSENELCKQNVNIVLRLKNRGHGAAFGILKWRYNTHLWQKIDITDLPPIHVHLAKSYNDYIIPIGTQITAPSPAFPYIQVEWDSLYMYH